ncbi:MAG: HlyD family efflux transporter periplasmic adaptor subunit [Firmicutes bacterium]|nr:HlyD family efflux transporter periplasmic adaptor subunit [Bacillota bacterium]
MEKRAKQFLHQIGKNRIRYIIYGLICLLLIVSIVQLIRKKMEVQTIAAGDTAVLEQAEFTNFISATGTVESAKSTLVYSTLANLVEGVYVEVGDYVEEGQLLARLDNQAIVGQIESQEASMRTASATGAQSIKSARESYDQFKYAQEKGLNSSINSAESQVASAYEGYTQAVKTYKRYREALEAGENIALLEAEYAYETAQKRCELLEKVGEEEEPVLGSGSNNGHDGEEEEPAKEPESGETGPLEKREWQLYEAQNKRDLAWAHLKAARTTVNETLADYRSAVESTRQAYEDALTNLEAARLAADNQLQSYARSISSAEAGADNSSARIALRQLKVTLDDTEITAPTSGTVTAVYARIGQAGSGLLFIIEDINDLVIETSVKEYDIGTVAVGMPVTIKSNATGDDLYEGLVTSIAPTSIKTSQGTTDISGEVEFATKVKVTSPGTRLRIGMNVRLNYITEQLANVLSVPYESIYTNQAGESCILILEDRPKADFYLVKELPVKTGSENDLVITISGSGVRAGLRLINEPDSYQALIGKEIKMAG